MLVEAVPFTHRGDTSTSTVRRIDRYSCAPGIDESGPEVWYALTVDEPGTLDIAIDERPDDGVDVDVHLLSDVHADACLARHNANLRYSVEPGPYWVVLDTHVDGGYTKTGSYSLRIGLE